MKELDKENLKLIYVLKVGYNYKYEGSYEFIFSFDETNIDAMKWGWDISPACDNAYPPENEYINEVINLKTDLFDLFCLHEAVDREYMHGYHNIHALAYEVERDDEDNTESIIRENYPDNEDDLPLLVFHYGMSLAEVCDLFYERNIILKEKEFVEAANIKIIH
jgi:hypothetical protein